MARQSFEPQDFGIDLSKEDFVDQMADAFSDTYKGNLSVDELLLHPREALRFCDNVRSRYACYEVPDHVILRSILQRRKNP